MPPPSTEMQQQTFLNSPDKLAIDVSVVDNSGAGRGVVIGLLSAFGSAGLVALIFLFIYFFRYTSRGRIFLDRMGSPGEYDDEVTRAREEAEALETMDEISRLSYLRAKGMTPHSVPLLTPFTSSLISQIGHTPSGYAFCEANPPESVPTDISLSQFLAIQEKGVSAWEFEAELEIANCFVEQRTEVEFFDSECSVQSNLPVPKQNEVYYWEAKLYDKPDNTLISIGMSTKPYPMFRLPGYHKHSVAYTSTGHRRYNQSFHATPYGPSFLQGDVIGVGYRPRTGTIFFTRNGKKLDDVAHGLKSLNLFPTLGANGPCTVHVNFGQLGFVFIEANVKKWGLAPMTGSLAPPPPYGSEQGSILLETGQRGLSPAEYFDSHGHRPRPAQHPTSPGPARSPTDISLTHFDPPAPAAVTTTIRPPSPPPDYCSQHSASDSSDSSSGSADTLLRKQRAAERERLLRSPTPAYGDIVRDRSPAPGPGGRYRSGSAPAGPSGSRV
ncbi:concanavalin A-like lectin/glucanase domain-containing protein [Geopyxis carbonaria]|nr:concanavalin A-like lectin/glucanase domain-containing protein [Geopyxis carbonaria]